MSQRFLHLVSLRPANPCFFRTANHFRRVRQRCVRGVRSLLRWPCSAAKPASSPVFRFHVISVLSSHRLLYFRAFYSEAGRAGNPSNNPLPSSLIYPKMESLRPISKIKTPKHSFGWRHALLLLKSPSNWNKSLRS